MELSDLDKYLIELSDFDITLTNQRIKGDIKKAISKQFENLDCTRIVDGLRLMQTIGYPYMREMSITLNMINRLEDESEKESYLSTLLEVHNNNLKYEETNPPIWYGGKKAKREWEAKQGGKLPRRRKKREQTIPGFESKAKKEARLQEIAKAFGNVKFKVNFTKKN